MPTDFPGTKPPVNTLRLLIGLGGISVGLYALWNGSQQPAAKPELAPVELQAPEAVTEATPETEPSSAPSLKKRVQTQISNVTVRDQDGKVIYRGTVDVGPTLQRIGRGEKLRFPNDGSVFENRERRLPKKSTGHYREYVHSTSGQNGPGPQRIVKGKEGEIFYSHDHYRTFLRLDQP